jgi:hypothetical protein
VDGAAGLGARRDLVRDGRGRAWGRDGQHETITLLGNGLASLFT